MLKQKVKRQMWQALAAFSLLALLFASTPAMADVAPPKGKIRLSAIHAIKPPKTEPKAVFMLVRTSERDPAHLALSPFAWGRPFSPARCYRCQTKLAALSPAQGQKLLGIIEKHPAFASAHKVLKKLNAEAKLQWLSRVKFQSLTEAAQGPKAKPLTKAIVDFFKKEKYASTGVLPARLTVDDKHKGRVVFVAHRFEKIDGQNIVLKEMARQFRPDPSKRGMMPGQRARRRRKPIALARNPWFYVGVLLLLGVVFFSTRRR